jgi:chromosome segregation ATPase
MVARIQVENLSLEEKLKAAEAKASRFEEAIKQAEAEIKGRNSTIQEAQMTIQLHQQDILNWMAVAEWYQTKCFQCSNVLGQMMAFLQDTTSELK